MIDCPYCEGHGMLKAPGGDIASKWPCDHCGMVGKVKEDTPVPARERTPTLSYVTCFRYRNHRGEVGVRRIANAYWRYGASEFHPGASRWILRAYDVDKQGMRDFALEDILEWLPPEVP